MMPRPRLRPGRGFTIVELLVSLALILIIFTAGYFLFLHSYQQVKYSSDKMENLHQVALLVESLRNELTGISSREMVEAEDTSFLNPGKHTSIRFRDDQAILGSGLASKTATGPPVEYKFDASKKLVKKTTKSGSQEWGKGKILTFEITHNIAPNPKDQKLPVWFKINVETLDEKQTQIKLGATVLPRAWNRNLGLKQKQ